MHKHTVTIEATGVKYYSPADEAAFLRWLGNLLCVKKIEKRLQAFHIDIDVSTVDENCLYELLAIFRRYGIPPKKLAVLDCEELASWFLENEISIDKPGKRYGFHENAYSEGKGR